MYRLLPVFFEMIPAAAVLFPLTVLWQRCLAPRPRRGHTCLLALFSLYLFAVFALTGLPAVGTVSPEITASWIPFSDAAKDARAWLSGAVLNILLFLPLGIAAPLLWREFCRLPQMLLLGFGVSLFIETMQLLTFRVTDVDDLLMNTLGALLGWGAALAAARHPKIRALGAEQTVSGAAEASFAATVVFLYYFFVQPPLSRLLFG